MSSLWDAPHGFTTGPTGAPMQLLVCTTCFAVVEKAYAEKHKRHCDTITSLAHSTVGR